VLAGAVLVATSLDLAATLLRSARSDARTRRRVFRAVTFLRVALVFVAWIIAFAFRELPFGAFAVLGLVPLVYGVLGLRRRDTPPRIEVAGATSSVVATLSLSGDDVAAWIVLLRWHSGVDTWPVTVVLVIGAVAVPWLALRARGVRVSRVSRTLAWAAPYAQIAAGVALVVLSALDLR
jgi:hypothetical protein